MSDLVGNPEDRFSHNEAHLNVHNDDSDHPGHSLSLVSHCIAIALRFRHVDNQDPDQTR